MTTTRPAWAYTLPAALLLMAPFDILASLAMDIYLPVVPAMPGVLNTTPSIIQLTLSLYMVMLGVGQVIFGPLSDRVGRRPILLVGATAFVAASLGAACSSTALAFVAFRLVQAVGASAMLVATFATVRDVYANRPEGAVIYGLFSSMLAFVPALGPIAGALIGEFWGWQAIFITLAALASLALLNASFRWHETRPLDQARTQRSVLPIFASPAFWVYTVGFSAGMGTFFVFFSTAPRGHGHDNPLRKVLRCQMGYRGMRSARDGVARFRRDPVGDRPTFRIAVIFQLHPADVGCRGRHCLHGVRYRQRRTCAVRRHRWISGCVLLLHPKPDSQYRRDIGGDAVKRRYSVARDLLRHGNGSAGVVGAGAPSIP